MAQVEGLMCLTSQPMEVGFYGAGCEWCFQTGQVVLNS